MIRPVKITDSGTSILVEMAVALDGTFDMSVRKENIIVKRIEASEGTDAIKIIYPNGEEADLHYSVVQGIGENEDPTTNKELLLQINDIL